ncbi:M1 family metallopeptidase [Sporanaerobacter acetigenes]|uniref:M1 family metallopeptidase n=1 Tax=Sporanaerobacter acetigenes TaxID=165813 RepID=UPI00104C72BD|nr:M1 family metallopeptidase [Sporanaerobacter acetigenes]
MSKIKRFLLIVMIILIIFSMIGCDTKEGGTTSTTGGIDTPKEKIGQTDFSSKADWESYLSEEKYNRNVLDIKTPNEYKIYIEFDPIQKKYIGKQSVKYINNEDVSLSEIYFHIYPNAFKEDSTTPYSSDSYIGGFNSGLINVTKVMVEGKKIKYSILGDDSTLLKIPMKSALVPGKSVEIYMEYEVILPNAEERFGYGDNTFQIGNGYPIAAVYDSRKWNIDSYYSMGDPFYSDISNYSVTIKAPKDYIISCSGKILSEEVQGESKVWNVEAKLMRDFAWAASQDFIIQEKVIDGVLVKNYLLPNSETINTEAAELAYKSVEVYNKIFGKYPYEVLSVVTADATGMEYPGMVFVWKSNKLNDKSLETTIIHEVAHQWWYGVVGNNQIYEAWLDESFAIYAEKLFYDEVYGEEQGEKYYDEIVDIYKNRIGDSGKKELILMPTYMIEDGNEYTGLLLKGAMFLHEIEKDLGKDKFYNILNTYYEKYKFSIATTRDFIDVCEELAERKYEEDINNWFFGVKKKD